jgi:hypothetical protein
MILSHYAAPPPGFDGSDLIFTMKSLKYCILKRFTIKHLHLKAFKIQRLFGQSSQEAGGAATASKSRPFLMLRSLE